MSPPSFEDQSSAPDRTSVRSVSPFEELASYSRAVRTGPLLVVSGTAAPADPETGRPAPDAGEQTRAALGVALDSLRELGAGPEDVVMTRLYLVPGSDWHAAATAHGEVFRGIDPANTTLFVAALIPEGALVEVELVAYAAEAGGQA